MSVFRNYNNQQAGGVNANAFPRVHPIPWIPNQRNVRANPNIPSQPQRIQPQERGTFYPTSASNSGTLAPAMSSGCSNCGGSCAGCGSATPSSTPTASDVSTTHSFPRTVTPRIQARATGALRPNIRPGLRTNLSKPTFGGMRGL